MVKGKVINRFMDKNTEKIYAVGDEYKTSTTKRLNELIDLKFIESIEKETPKGENDQSPEG